MGGGGGGGGGSETECAQQEIGVLVSQLKDRGDESTTVRLNMHSFLIEEGRESETEWAQEIGLSVS